MVSSRGIKAIADCQILLPGIHYPKQVEHVWVATDMLNYLHVCCWKEVVVATDLLIQIQSHFYNICGCLLRTDHLCVVVSPVCVPPAPLPVHRVICSHSPQIHFIMASACCICGAVYSCEQSHIDPRTRCKPCRQHVESHQLGQGNSERPWYLWDTADAIARDLLPHFRTYRNKNPGENPCVKPRQAGKPCRTGCGNLGVSKSNASLCPVSQTGHDNE